MRMVINCRSASVPGDLSLLFWQKGDGTSWLQAVMDLQIGHIGGGSSADSGRCCECCPSELELGRKYIRCSNRSRSGQSSDLAVKEHSAVLHSREKLFPN